MKRQKGEGQKKKNCWEYITIKMYVAETCVPMKNILTVSKCLKKVIFVNAEIFWQTVILESNIN